jgi:hypothetical protein
MPKNPGNPRCVPAPDRPVLQYVSTVGSFGSCVEIGNCADQVKEVTVTSLRNKAIREQKID